MTVTRLPIAALACSLGSRMNTTLSYCRVSVCDRVRSSFQAKASSRSSPARSGRCRSLSLAGAFGKARVVVGDESREESVAFRQGCRTRQRQFLDQAVLQRLVGTLDPTLGRARIGANDVDVERMQGAAKLGHPVTAKRTRMVDPKDAMLVAVKGDRLAPGLQIGAGRMKIGKGRLALDKLQMHQPAGRVIDKHQQSALRPAILEPPMFAAVDLHQFANALAPRPRLVDASALLAIAPQPVNDHPLPQGLAGERKTVLGGELLGGQSRPEISVVVAHDPQHRGAHRR